MLTGPGRAMQTDPITVEIIQSSLQAISDEMFAAMRKTAMSAIIYEVLDMGTGLTDAAGQLASSGAGIPAFVGVLDKAVQFVLQKFAGTGKIAPGDVFITNDPWHGAVTHLNDAVLAMPVFAGGALVAWVMNIAHWNDVGGMTAGSMSTDAKEIFQEGLRLPAVKLFDRGQPETAVFDIIYANSRLPDYVRGDLWAGISAVRLGERRVRELVAKYGADVYLDAVQQHMDRGEMATRAGLRQLPHGRFTLAEEQDDRQIFNVAVEITADHFTIDLRDNPDQEQGPNNVSYDGSLLVAQMVLKALTDPGFVCNGGSFRPLRLLTRPGSLFHAELPAALSFYCETEIRLYDLIWRCLAPHLPGLLPAGHFSSICGTVIGGRHPDTGRHFTIVEPQLGGWGASSSADGSTALFSVFHGETFNCPAEISEARNGLVVDRITLNDAGGGAGQYRGGRGIVVDYRIRSDESFLTCGYTRTRIAPWGASGGRAGSPNGVEIHRPSGVVEHHAFATGVPLRAGDVVRISTGNGGGFGDPRERSRDQVALDLRNGHIGLHEARSVYGLAPERA
jgi:N-methylhydantoinase B